MIKVENIEVFNFKGAFRGMRNPLESWEKSDSFFGEASETYFDSRFDDMMWDMYLEEFEDTKDEKDYDMIMEQLFKYYQPAIERSIYDDHSIKFNLIGPKDMKLAQKLILAGTDHSKFMRQIFVSMDITGPLYW